MKLLKIATLILIATTIHQSTFSQSFDDLNDRKGKNAFLDRGIHFFARYTYVNCKYTEAYGGITFNGSFRIDRTGKGEFSYRLENPTIGDLIFVLFNIERMRELTTEQAYGAGIFGWHQGYWNVVSTDRLLISPGITFGDYIFGSKQADGKMHEPQGYYFHLGPAFKTSYVLTSDLWVDGYVHYDIGFKAGKGTGEHVKGYPKPHFLNIGGTINHVPTRLFGGFRLNTLIDRGPSKDAGSRLDISAGFYF